MGNVWSKQEEEFLVLNYPTKGLVYCSEELNRSQGSIGAKAKRLNIKSLVQAELLHSVKRRTHEQYEQILFDKELDAFTLEEYVNSYTAILHTCSKSHMWKAIPNNILKGRGCPYCNKHGFNKDKPAILYFVSFYQGGIQYYKIGITNKSIEERFIKEKHPITIEWFIGYEKGVDAYNAEQKILRNNNQYLINTGMLKSGNTETFTIYIEKEN